MRKKERGKRRRVKKGREGERRNGSERRKVC